MLSLLCLLCIGVEPAITIVVDDTPESAWLIRDLRCDYNAHAQADEDSRYLAYVQEELCRYITLIHYQDVHATAATRMFSVQRYPAYKLGKYHAVQYMPTRMVLERTYSMLELKNSIDVYNDTDSYSKWQRACRRAFNQAERDYHDAVVEFMIAHDSDGLIPEAYTVINDLALYEDKFADWPTFPREQPPILPPRPTLPHPWQDGYRYTEFQPLTPLTLD